MNIFVAGATGAIGRPLIKELIRQGHMVTGLCHSDASAQVLAGLGARVARASALDAMAVEQALRTARAEVVIDQLTSLPKNPADLAQAQAGDYELRIEGGGNLLRAAQACGVRRYLQQSSGFFLQAAAGLADESAPLAVDASPGVAFSSRSYAQLEARLAAAPIEGVALRYGFFYGPGTWYSVEGGCGDLARRQKIAIIGSGNGVWSWVHIDDAAQATVAALTAPVGTYNVVDDDPSAVSIWLPAFARAVGAPEPPQMSEERARQQLGEDAVFYGTRLCGASNAKARSVLGFVPRRLEWLST
ncbi:MAG TPA: NAD(P)-dependent oxidoreductase [Pirellulales bacterium]|nr:NAD(P)-dependent oxidoreductase [Pirellulales bacterium]